MNTQYPPELRRYERKERISLSENLVILGIFRVWTQSKMYGHNPKCMDTIQSVWTQSKMYGHNQKYMDTIQSVWTK